WDDRSEKLIQQNHPDMGWLYRDKDGNGEPDDGHPGIMPHIDVVEIHPVPDILTLDPFLTVSTYQGNNRIFNWLQLLNQGYRLAGVVNTDAHFNYHESGFLRNWIRSPTDDPAQIKPLDIVRAAEAGALIMSNGPFLEVEVREAGQRQSAGACSLVRSWKRSRENSRSTSECNVLTGSTLIECSCWSMGEFIPTNTTGKRRILICFVPVL
ncbi:MAG: hypothetical protein O3B86_02240, partial [Planctomycetota bacterium]|nr:hypothetical protein [Planctomycetota bacterium]